jgi:hypothetical protein
MWVIYRRSGNNHRAIGAVLGFGDNYPEDCLFVWDVVRDVDFDVPMSRVESWHRTRRDAQRKLLAWRKGRRAKSA